MKKYILYAVIILCTIVSCNKGILDSYPVEEVFVGGEVKMEEISQKLKNAENGWNFQLKSSMVSAGNMISGYFEFENDEKFSFVADYNSNFAKVNADNNYNLSSDKNLLKINFKKSLGNSISKYGEILLTTLSDSVFTFNGEVADSLIFVGDRKGNILKLYKSTTQDQEYYKNLGLYNYVKAQEFINYPKFFFNVEVGEKKLFFYKDEVTSNLIFHFKEGNVGKFHSTKYKLSPKELVLETPFFFDGMEIKGFSNYKIENENFIYEGGTIKNESKPIEYVSAITDFMKANSTDTDYGLWKSNLGWSKRGAIDFYALKWWRSDYQVIFRYRNGNNSNFHRIGTAYFPGWFWWGGDYRVTSVEKDNLSFFTYLAVHNGVSSQSYVQMLQDTNLQEMTNENGLYIIKTVDNQIVLINGKDAESWIFYK